MYIYKNNAVIMKPTKRQVDIITDYYNGFLTRPEAMKKLNCIRNYEAFYRYFERVLMFQKFGTSKSEE